MAEYWVAFRLAAGPTYDQRYRAMLDAMVQAGDYIFDKPDGV